MLILFLSFSVYIQRRLRQPQHFKSELNNFKKKDLERNLKVTPRFQKVVSLFKDDLKLNGFGVSHSYRYIYNLLKLFRKIRRILGNLTRW